MMKNEQKEQVMEFETLMQSLMGNEDSYAERVQEGLANALHNINLANTEEETEMFLAQMTRYKECYRNYILH